MPVFHSIKIDEVRKETPDAVSVHFDIPENIREEYRYKPGQYLTLKVDVNGEEVRRAYSLCTSPYIDDKPAIAVKRVEGGKVSNFINDKFSEGQELEVMTPMGNFTTELNEFYSRQFVLYAGGSGITPMMSILKSVLEIEQSSHVTLIYGNRDQESVIFKKELEELEGHFADRFKIIHVLDDAPEGWEGETGILSQDKVKSLVEQHVEGDLNKAQHFICGPSPMMDSVKSALGELSVDGSKIHIEYFTSNISQDGEDHSKESGAEDEDDGDFSGVGHVNVDLQGENYEVEVSEKETILQAGLEAGIDPPFACQMGICTTCRAKLLKGKVHMEETEGLTQDELDNDYILTCQSHPKSNKIEIRYE